MKWLRFFRRRRRREEELDEEIRAHLTMAIRERIEQGEDPAEAEANVRREFGNVTLVKEVTRDMWGWRWLETFLQDLRYGLRQLRRNPGFTVVAVLTLALGIGANTAIFSVIDAALLRPLPYRHPNRLVWVETLGSHFTGFTKSSGPDFLDWRSENHVFSHMTAYETRNVTVLGEKRPALVRAAYVYQDFFHTFGIDPILGREVQHGSDDEAIISHQMWEQRFGGNPLALGKKLSIKGKDFVIIGVMPKWFDYPVGAQLWMPLGIRKTIATRNIHHLDVVARLRPGVTLQHAQIEMSTISRRLALEHPSSDRGRTAELSPLREHLVGRAVPKLMLLWGAVGLVLLIACVNVGNLLLARTTARSQEIAVRAALGAGAWRLARQLLTEAVLLSLIGAAAGLAVAFGCMPLLSRLVPNTVQGIERATVDGHVLEYSLLLAVITGLLFGMAPVLRVLKMNSNEQLKEVARSLAPGTEGGLLQRCLVVSEIGLALMLLVGAGLLIASFWRLQDVNPGFNPIYVLTMPISLPGQRYAHAGQRNAFFRSLLDRVDELPGVKSTALVDPLPFGGGWLKTEFVPEGWTRTGSGNKPVASLAAVSPGYFTTMRIPLLEGRYFRQSDGRESSPAVIVDEQLAHTFWPHQHPIGKFIEHWKVKLTVIGVVGHVKSTSLAGDPGPELYVPIFGDPPPFGTVVVRTSVAPATLVPLVRKQVWALDNELPVSNIATMREHLAASVKPQRSDAYLLSVFGVVGLLLAAVGIYGVVSYSVRRRTHEIGIRMALGAENRDVLWMVLRQGLKLAFIGIAIGIVGAFALTRFLSSLLYGVKPTDPLTFIAVSLILIAVALVACHIPARRAAKVDPMVALRYE